MFAVIALLALLYAIMKFGILPIFHFKSRGIPYDKPWPFLGNLAKVLFYRESFFDFQENVYKRFRKFRYYGFFQIMTPTLYINDPELIKRICVKDFDHFVDHRKMGSNHEVLFKKNLFLLQGAEWRTMRSFLSPAFTASKMKGMCELMASCAQHLTAHFLEQKQEQIDVELKDLFSRYANDVIATCAFGLECDSLKDKDNQFFKMGQDSIKFDGLRGLKMILANFAPTLCKLMRIRMFPKRISDFFIDIIKDTIAYRENEKVVRPDVIHLLLEARKGKLKNEAKQVETNDGFAVVEEATVDKEEDARMNFTITDIDIACHCFIFFIAGFDAISTLLSFVVTELAINVDVQEKLFQEIDKVMKESHGKPGYEQTMGMKYLDMVVTETLRLWPGAPVLDRLCTKDFVVEPKEDHEVPIKILRGELIAIPIIGIHRDERYFENPRRFDPERFSDANKYKIQPYTYMPFGIGQRSCIANRFALLETKILLVYLLHKFEATVVEKTSVPIVLTKSSFRMAPVNGFWVGLRRRKLSNSLRFE